jgi:hypothetical protein
MLYRAIVKRKTHGWFERLYRSTPEIEFEARRRPGWRDGADPR